MGKGCRKSFLGRKMVLEIPLGKPYELPLKDWNIRIGWPDVPQQQSNSLFQNGVHHLSPAGGGSLYLFPQGNKVRLLHTGFFPRILPIKFRGPSSKGGLHKLKPPCCYVEFADNFHVKSCNCESYFLLNSGITPKLESQGLLYIFWFIIFLHILCH